MRAPLEPYVLSRDHEGVMLRHGPKAKGGAYGSPTHEFAVMMDAVGLPENVPPWLFGIGLLLAGTSLPGEAWTVVALGVAMASVWLALSRPVRSIRITPRSIRIARVWGRSSELRLADLARVRTMQTGVVFELRQGPDHHVELPKWPAEAHEALVELVRAQIDVANREGTAADVPNALRELARREPER